MDNRLRFLYHMVSELWGRGRITGAGNGKTGASAKAEAVGKSAAEKLKRYAERTYSSEARESTLPRKAAIVWHVPVP